jgi:TonB dependent receptor/Carboxypeptidase regulatory-like domain
MTTWRTRFAAIVALTMLFGVIVAPPARAQGLGGAGTVQGTVKDPTGGVMQSVDVKITNPVSGFTRTVTTDAAGKYTFSNIPPNPYHLSVGAQGFQRLERDVDVRSAVPITIDLTLALEGTTSTVEVVGHAEDLLERDPSAHTDIDQTLIARLPVASSAGLNQVITLASPGIVSDSNGFFHPIGDHAQTQFSIDNQPVTDQQSRLYSNQISEDAVESMELITGVAPAEYGDKSSLVVHIVTKSGLDQPKPTGSVSLGYGSFQSPTVDVNIGGGSHTVGNFLSLSGMRTDRFLDSPEFQALHDTGNHVSLFDRLDAHAGATGTFHLNVQVARSAFDVPNTLDAAALSQAQHQQINTFNVAPGFSQVIGSKTLFTVNAFVRQDHLTYTPSPNPFADQPGTVSQDRKLTNLGIKADVAYNTGNHNVKVGGSISATKLAENLTIGFTDPTFNSPCLDASGNPSDDTALTMVSQCRGALTANPDFNPDTLAFDLTRRGSPFAYSQTAPIKQQAAYIQDDIKAGNATFKVGVRLDHYDGLTTATQLQPRLGVSYAVPGSNTVLRASYGRTLETPYNENLLLSSGVGAEALTGTTTPPQPGKRDQEEVGIQQAVGRWIVADVGYFNKHTVNGYDFNVLFNTPITFPVAWDHSNINGFTGRVNLVEHGGFSAFMVLAHTNAVFFPPGVGGVLLTPPCDMPGCSFRIDHDQKLNVTTNLQYLFNKRTGTWAALNWRYDSGLVSSSIGDVNDLLNLTPAQQAAIGMSCGGVPSTPAAGFTSCAPGSISASRLVVPAAGTGDPLDNPARVAPRHLFDLDLGIDNLLHGDKAKMRVRFSVINLTNKEALYNFLSTFSGTHFVTPRAYQVNVGVTF